METKCQWCGEPLFITDSEERVVYPDGRTKLVTAEGMCPNCQKKNTVIKSIDVNFVSDLTIRSGEDIDGTVCGFLNDMDINIGINKICTRLKDRLENLVPNDLKEKPKKIVLIYNGDELIKDVNTLADCIRDNYDTRDLRQWIDEEFGDITIGPSTFSSSDIIDNLGDYDDIAQEKYECDYAMDRISSADLESLGDLTTEDCNLIEGQVIKVAGLSFTVGLVDKE